MLTYTICKDIAEDPSCSLSQKLNANGMDHIELFGQKSSYWATCKTAGFFEGGLFGANVFNQQEH
jgi:hypothetical protein